MNEPSSSSELCVLKESLRRFAEARDWDQFHTPKNLAMALCVEASELLEHFQWLKDDESSRLPEAKLAAVKEEVADVLLYLIRLADKLDIDLASAAAAKIELNAAKYPADKAWGSSRKYSEL